MSTLKIRIPQNQPELEAAIVQFLQDELQQTASFQPELTNAVQHKDGGSFELLCQVLSVIATIDGVISFSQRAQRLERVKKLQAAIERAGKPVFISLKNKTIDLYKKSVDEIMNLLGGDED